MSHETHTYPHVSLRTYYHSVQNLSVVGVADVNNVDNVDIVGKFSIRGARPTQETHRRGASQDT